MMLRFTLNIDKTPQNDCVTIEKTIIGFGGKDEMISKRANS
jgi:hypothetical protein